MSFWQHPLGEPLILTAVRTQSHTVHTVPTLLMLTTNPFCRSCTGRKWGLRSSRQSGDRRTLFTLTPSSLPEHRQVISNHNNNDSIIITSLSALKVTMQDHAFLSVCRRLSRLPRHPPQRQHSPAVSWLQLRCDESESGAELGPGGGRSSGKKQHRPHSRGKRKCANNSTRNQNVHPCATVRLLVVGSISMATCPSETFTSSRRKSTRQAALSAKDVCTESLRWSIQWR